MPNRKDYAKPKLRKVTPENYPLMKSLLASGLSQADLRRAFHISAATTFVINRFDTYDEYHDYIIEQSRKAKAKAAAVPAEAPAEVPEETPAEKAVEKPVENLPEEKHPAFVPSFTEANQERIIELLEQILAKLDCAEMAVVSDDEPKRRGLFSFGSKSPF